MNFNLYIEEKFVEILEVPLFLHKTSLKDVFGKQRIHIQYDGRKTGIQYFDKSRIVCIGALEGLYNEECIIQFLYEASRAYADPEETKIFDVLLNGAFLLGMLSVCDYDAGRYKLPIQRPLWISKELWSKEEPKRSPRVQVMLKDAYSCRKALKDDGFFYHPIEKAWMKEFHQNHIAEFKKKYCEKGEILIFGSSKFLFRSHMKILLKGETFLFRKVLTKLGYSYDPKGKCFQKEVLQKDLGFEVSQLNFPGHIVEIHFL